MRTKPVLINITYGGQSGSWYTHIDTASDDHTIRRLCEEAVRGGEVPGVARSIPHHAFRNFVIDRFHGGGVHGETRFVVRPKVPFG